MTPPTSTKKTATLARVRDNQRRCRARKREYVVELERKIQDLQAAGAQANIENYQNTIQRLEAENTKLRGLLNQAGFGQSYVEARLQGGEISHSWVEAQLQEGDDVGDWEGGLKLIEGQQVSFVGDNVNEYTEPARHEESATLLPNIYGAGTFDDLLDIPHLEVPDEEISFSPPDSAQVTDNSPLSRIRDGTGAFSCDSLLFNGRPACPPSASPLITSNLGHLNATSSASGTTLCSIAYSLVRQHNKKGVDMMEIGMRLWNGLTKGYGDEGCKVENKLLFSVLEYIRG